MTYKTIFAALMAASSVAAGASGTVDLRVARDANCHVRLTNDHVSRVVMYSDVARSAADCRRKASTFALGNLVSMRDAVRVLYYETEFNGRNLGKVNLKG
ncbi:MAG: hypothetical protein ABJP48_08210 [Erythrobacter sp.]